MQAPGGWYCSERRGELRSPEMLVTYDNLFVVIGMARYAQATGRKDVLGEAWRLFELIEEKTVVGELSENGVNGAWSQSAGRGDDPYSPHQYSGNTVLHYLEALSCLAAAGIGTDLSGRVKGIRALFTKYFVSESPFCVHGYFGDSFADPYTGVGASFSLGHALEWIDFFRCFPGLELPGSVERKILDFAIAAGVQPNGLFMDNYYINEQGSAGECEFWPQVEAAKTFNLACSVYGEPYGEVFRKMARCYFDLWVDDDGGVFHSIDRNGIVIERRKGDHWKCDYHSMRLCVEVLERDGGALPQ
jgi:mannobiose 2-epimerase